MNHADPIQALLEQLKQRKSVVIVSGAGISASAGFPTFVDARTKRYQTKTKNIFDANVTNPIILSKIASSFNDLKEAAKG